MESKEQFSILIVDDDLTSVRLLRSILAPFTPLRFAASGRDAMMLAKKSAPDLVLLDVEMPDINGFDLCKTFKADKSLATIPIVFVSSHDSVELQTAALQLGAADFITKPPHAALLLARIRAQMGTKRLSDTLRDAVMMDFLTGTSNRLHFEKALQQEWLRARRSRSMVCLVLLELHDIALYERNLGEASADEALREMAGALRQVVKRPADLLARYGAGTFAMLLPETDLAGVHVVAHRALHATEALTRGWQEHGLTLSVGIACSRAVPDGEGRDDDQGGATTKEELMEAAEQSLAVARQSERPELTIAELQHRLLPHA